MFLLRKAEKPPIQQIIDANLVPKLIKFTERDDEPNLQVRIILYLVIIK